MAENPALEEFIRLVDGLKRHSLIAPHLRRGEMLLQNLSVDDIATLLKSEVARYFLLAAAGLNRTSLKKEAGSDTAKLVEAPKRKAYAVRERLPIRVQFDEVASHAAVLRRADLQRRSKGTIEALFRERLKAEGIPLLMSPPIRQVPGILIARRKPDGVYPDPAQGLPPLVYFEIKNVRRVADDIQKRLYEIAEAAIEMKTLYGGLTIQGFEATSTTLVLENCPAYRARLRAQILQSRPTVVVLMLCSAVEADRYRAGAEAFVDRVFFQEEIDDCLKFLKRSIAP